MAQRAKGGMTREEEHRINSNISKIRQVLDPKDIIWMMIQDGVFTMEDKQEMMNNNPDTVEARNKTFLDALRKGNSETYSSFIRALRGSGYRQLADAIQSSDDSDGKMPGPTTARQQKPKTYRKGKMREDHQIKIQANMSDILDQLDAEDILDYFVEQGLLDYDGEQKVRKNNPNTRKRRTEAFMDIFVGMEDRAFCVFLSALGCEGYGSLADAIENTSAQNEVGESADVGQNAKDQIHTIDSGEGYASLVPGGGGATAAIQKSVQKLRIQDHPDGSAGRHGEFKAEHDATEPITSHQMIVACQKSVGIIKAWDYSATGFRVGERYLMTAWHVVRDILSKIPVPLSGVKQKSEKALESRDIYVDFDYLHASHCFSMSTRFYFQPTVLYSNEILDVAILELKENEAGTPFPNAFEHFGEFTDHLYQTSIRFIGHPGGHEKHSDKALKPLKLSFEQVNGARAWSFELVGRDGFLGINDDTKILFHCSFSKGASGSPGLVRHPNGLAYVVTMLIRGYPDWYFDPTVPQEKKVGIPNDHLLEQGVRLDAIVEDMNVRCPNILHQILPGTKK